MPAPLEGRVAVVTGASSGIGEATALALAGAGAAVALAARRQDRLEQLAEKISAEGGKALPIGCDVSDEAQARTFIERAHGELGGLSILVNNAGVMLLGPVQGADTADWGACSR
jgi:NADP-dependent 3-hydroxy acid dehydrogenase YdfG